MALRYEDMLERLGKQGQKSIEHTYQLWQDGLIDRATFIEVSAELLENIGTQGHIYGAVSYEELAALLTDTDPDYERALARAGSSSTTATTLRKSLTTIVDGDSTQFATRLSRLGYVLPIQQIQVSYENSLQQDTKALGWVRGLNDDACQLCQWWSHDGRVWPQFHAMPTHSGCRCQQIPTYSSNIRNTKEQERIERTRKAIANRDTTSSIVRRLMEEGRI